MIKLYYQLRLAEKNSLFDIAALTNTLYDHANATAFFLLFRLDKNTPNATSD